MPSSSTRHSLGQVGISTHQFLLWIQRMSVSPPYESLCVSEVVIDVRFLKGCLAHCEHLIHFIFLSYIYYIILNSLSLIRSSQPCKLSAHIALYFMIS